MNNPQTTKKFDLEERTFIFAQNIKSFVESLPKSLSNIEYGKQLIRSSGSVAANYIEANEALSKKGFLMRIKICRKEVKETRLWLRLIDRPNNTEVLITEINELMRIFGSIVTKLEV